MTLTHTAPTQVESTQTHTGDFYFDPSCPWAWRAALTTQQQPGPGESTLLRASRATRRATRRLSPGIGPPLPRAQESHRGLAPIPASRTQTRVSSETRAQLSHCPELMPSPTSVEVRS